MRAWERRSRYCSSHEEARRSRQARYYADTPDGRKRKTLYGKTRREVADKLAKAIAAQEAPPAFVPTSITGLRPRQI